MLYPQSNASRTVLDLSGVWDFRLHQDAPWQSIAVPASYNDQSADPEFRRHVGLCWYRRTFTVPSLLRGQRLMLRFDAVTHNARVFLNGDLLCTHRGGFLPFEADVTDLLTPGSSALLEIEVDNTINHNTLPIGNEGGTSFFGSDNPGIPSVEAGKRLQQEKGINLPNFDFFNYAGITRPVRLYTTPVQYIRDVTIVPTMDGTVRYQVETSGEGDVCVTIIDATGKTVASATGATGTVQVPNPILWEPYPGTPYLYTARFTFGEDTYEQTFGIREIKVEGCQFLINGKPFHFHGPCKHEDSFFHGRGIDECLNVTDINLFHWLHANAFRTSHYPYAEEMLSLCDREGIVIIAETPAVGISAGPVNPYEWGTQEYHRQVLADMIARDKNHPSIVMWSLGNEPNTDEHPQSSYDYWHPLYELAHQLDPQDRPVTLVGCQNNYTRDITIPSMDVVCINRYYGWYNLSGDMEAAAYAMCMELDHWAKINKPTILSEYGADTIAGLHGHEMFTEEFQVEFYKAINACLDERPFIVGETPWNFADFGTAQGPMRAGGNRKGLFTRDRKPKMAAHYFRERWENFHK